jgi:hypothetical protein
LLTWLFGVAFFLTLLGILISVWKLFSNPFGLAALGILLIGRAAWILYGRLDKRKRKAQSASNAVLPSRSRKHGKSGKALSVIRGG